jgi:hypothetical protein
MLYGSVSISSNFHSSLLVLNFPKTLFVNLQNFAHLLHCLFGIMQTAVLTSIEGCKLHDLRDVQVKSFATGKQI